MLLRWTAVAMLVAGAVACGGSTPSVAEQAQAIEGQVWSPYCPGRLLIDCTTRQARELRAEIEHRIGEGESSDEVLEWIRDDFGASAVARPGPGPGGLLLWLFPAAVFASGFVIVLWVIRHGGRRSLSGT